MQTTATDDTTIHIKLSKDLSQLRDENIALAILEQNVCSIYNDVTVTKNINKYGLLTDVFIKFNSVNDATHFKLTRMYN